jgi:hypothetical protein
MYNEKNLNEAINLLHIVVKQYRDWQVYTDSDRDLLQNQIELFLKRFRPKPLGRYRQVDIEESIEQILKKPQ